jgi:hypothetical protein
MIVKNANTLARDDETLVVLAPFKKAVGFER